MAGTGNETLIGSASGNDTLAGSMSGNDQFGFQYETFGNTYEVDNFHVGDSLYFKDAATASAAIAGYATAGKQRRYQPHRRHADHARRLHGSGQQQQRFPRVTSPP